MAAIEEGGPHSGEEGPLSAPTPQGFALSRLLTLDEQLYVLLRDPQQHHSLRGEDSLLLAAAAFLEITRAGALQVEGRQFTAPPGYLVARPHLAGVVHRTTTGPRKDSRTRRVIRLLARSPGLWPDVENSLAHHGIASLAHSPVPRTPADIGHWCTTIAQELRTYLTPVVAGANPFAPPRLVLLAGLVCLTGLVDHLVPSARSYGVPAARRQAARLLSDPTTSHELTPRALVAQRAIVSGIHLLEEFFPSSHGGP